jgi:hypothetical protein
MRFVEQNQADFASEIRVQPDHLLGEIQFVDDSLTGAVAAGEKLQVIDAVVLPIAVDVMNRFFGEEVSSKVFRHDVPMFHNRFGTAVSRQHRYGDPNVAVAFYVTLNLAGFKTLGSLLAVVGVVASWIAEFLLVVKASAWAPFSRVVFPAVKAHERVSFFCVFFSSLRRAGHRAVERVSTKFFAIGSQIGRRHRKRFFAVLADECFGRDSRGGAAVFGFVRSQTISAAKFASEFSFAGDAKGLLAVFTRFLSDHVVTPLLGGKRVMTWSAA